MAIKKEGPSKINKNVVSNIRTAIRNEGAFKFLINHVFRYANARYVRPIMPFLFHNKAGYFSTTWRNGNKDVTVKWYSTDYRLYIFSKRSMDEMEQVYSKLSIKNKTVVDIGASIADSSIYFALKGAKKVIAFEPIPSTFEIAKKNIEANNLQNRITLEMMGVNKKTGVVPVSEDYEGTPGSTLENLGSGRTIAITTLDKIVKDYGVRDAILKLNCEGYEYNILFAASRRTLSVFSEIMIQYHHGRANELIDLLKKSGFKNISNVPYKQNLIIVPEDSHPHSGWVYAKKN